MNHFIVHLLVAFLVTVASYAQPAPKGIKIVGGKAPAGTERRAAILIANQNYDQSGLDLTRTHNDADDMKTALDKLGFEMVVFLKDLNRLTLDRTINSLATKLRGYQVAFFYYSGHGAEYEGKNYLLPTDMPPLEFRSDLATYGIPLDRVYAALTAGGVKTSIVVSDACRSLPMGKSAGVPTGMTIPASNPDGTFTMFATRSGNLALENAGGRNGYFTQELLKNMVRPDWPITKIYYETRKGVKAATNNQQDPSSANELDDEFVFVQTANTPQPNQPAVVEPRREPAKPAPVTDLPVGPAMVFLKGGTFQMGSAKGKADEKPIHGVTVGDFMLGKYEVTVEEFGQFVEATNYRTDAEKEDGSYVWTGSKYKKKAGISWRCDAEGTPRDRSGYTHPVIHVSHNDAVAYCGWLSRRTGNVYRLPTEAEWEYAAGGGSGSRSTYSWGNGAPSGRAGGNTDGSEDGYAFTAPVGRFAPNGLGLYDMSGNVFEWCADWYDDGYYANSSSSNPTGPRSGQSRVLRGGSWFNSPPDCRVADRGSSTPSYRDNDIGFRVLSQIQ